MNKMEVRCVFVYFRKQKDIGWLSASNFAICAVRRETCTKFEQKDRKSNDESFSHGGTRRRSLRTCIKDGFSMIDSFDDGSDHHHLKVETLKVCDVVITIIIIYNPKTNNHIQ